VLLQYINKAIQIQ